MFELLKEEVWKDYEKQKERIAGLIEKDEGPEFRITRNCCTELRWEQFLDGKITEEKLKELARIREFKSLEKDYWKRIEEIERVAESGDLLSASIIVEWSRGGPSDSDMLCA